MKLPFEPETMETARARFAQAVATVHDQEEISSHPDKAISKRRENTFDFPSGVRMMVSREKALDGDVVLHVSASLVEGSKLFGELQALPVSHRLHTFTTGCYKLYKELSGDKDTLYQLGITSGGVVHWSRREVPRG